MRDSGFFPAKERLVSKESEIRCLVSDLEAGGDTDGWRGMPLVICFAWDKGIDGCNLSEAGLSFMRRGRPGVRDVLSTPE